MRVLNVLRKGLLENQIQSVINHLKSMTSAEGKSFALNEKTASEKLRRINLEIVIVNHCPLRFILMS